MTAVSPEALLRRTLERHRMLDHSTGVLVALSGGGDSVALLHLLLPICRERGLPVVAFHLNHLLRGAESERDEQFVRALCERLSVPLVVRRAEIAALAKERGISIELAAREERYRLLRSCAAEQALSQIATAHTASDNLETVLFHLARGSGLDGLCGIPPVRGPLIRPLIAHTGESLRAYLRAHSLPFVEDSTNALPLYTRNRLRQNVIAPLREELPHAEETAARACELLRRDAACLQQLSQQLLQAAAPDGRARRAALTAAPDAVLSRALRTLAEDSLGVSLSSRHTEALLSLLREGKTGDRLQLPGGVALLTHHALLFERTGAAEPFFSQLLTPGAHILPGGTLTLREAGEKLNSLFNPDLLDCATIIGNLVVRERLPGDRVELPNGRSRLLKKLLIDRKIDRDRRRLIPVVCDDAGPIWTPLTGASSRCRAKQGALHTFALEFEGKV